MPATDGAGVFQGSVRFPDMGKLSSCSQDYECPHKLKAPPSLRPAVV